MQKLTMGDILLEELSSINAFSAVHMLNSYAVANFRKQEIALKIWLILGFDTRRMCNQLFFCGIDAGLIPKREAVHRRTVIDNYYQLNFPDINANHYKTNADIKEISEFNWCPYKVWRRSAHLAYYPHFSYAVCEDDVAALKNELEIIAEDNFNLVLKEAVYFGATNCVKYLIAMGIEIDPDIAKVAYGTGNLEIIDIVKKFQPNNIGISMMVRHWNNKLVEQFMDCNFGKIAKSAIESCNFVILKKILFDEKVSDLSNSFSGQGNTLFLESCKYNELDIANFLLEQGSIEFTTFVITLLFQRDAIQLAAKFNAPDVLEMLINQGAESTGHLLHYTAKFDMAECTRLLLEKGASVDESEGNVCFNE